MNIFKGCFARVSDFASLNPTEAGDAVPRTPWDIFRKKKDTGRTRP